MWGSVIMTASKTGSEYISHTTGLRTEMCVLSFPAIAKEPRRNNKPFCTFAKLRGGANDSHAAERTSKLPFGITK